MRRVLAWVGSVETAVQNKGDNREARHVELQQPSLMITISAVLDTLNDIQYRNNERDK